MEAYTRLDISHTHFLISIDANGAKVFDDAISIEKLKNGNYSVGVHVADAMVTMPKNYDVNEAAKSKAIDPHLNLSPEVRQACSLDPQTPRRAISVFVEYETNGKRTSKRPWIGRTLVQNRHAMTFESAQRIMRYKDDTSFMKHSESVRAQIRMTLEALQDLSWWLYYRRKAHWVMCMDIEPFACDLSANFSPNIHRAEYRIVHELMTVASECVAERLIEARKSVFEEQSELSCAEFFQFFNFLRNVGIMIEIQTDRLASHTHVLKKNSSAYRAIFKKICSLKGTGCICNEPNEEKADDHVMLEIKPRVPFTSPLRRSACLYTHFLLVKHLDKHPGFSDRANLSNEDASDDFGILPCTNKAQKGKRVALITLFRQKSIGKVPNDFMLAKSTYIMKVEKIGMDKALYMRESYRLTRVCLQTTCKNLKVIRIDFALVLSWPLIDDLIEEYIIQSSGMVDLRKHHDLFLVFRVKISKECVITLFVPRAYLQILEALLRGSLFMPERKASSILCVLNENCKRLAKSAYI